MAIVDIPALHVTDAAPPSSSTAFTTSGRGFWLHSSGLLKGEKVTLYGFDSNVTIGAGDGSGNTP